MSKLTIDAKACPFCGKTKLSIDSKSKNGYKGCHQTFSVRCNCCFARGGTVGGYTRKNDYCTEDIKVESKDNLIDKAIELWNKRS